MAAVLAVGMAQATRADEKPECGPLKVVVHVNVPESGTQGAGLKNVTNILKEAPDTQGPIDDRPARRRKSVPGLITSGDEALPNFAPGRPGTLTTGQPDTDGCSDAGW